VLAILALQLHAVCRPGGQDSGRENLGISNDEKTSLDLRRERGGERTVFCAVWLACRASIVLICSPDESLSESSPKSPMMTMALEDQTTRFQGLAIPTMSCLPLNRKRWTILRQAPGTLRGRAGRRFCQ
jgi:hypothetical protein